VSKGQVAPLADLNRHIERATGRAAAERGELRSASAFHDSWARLSAVDTVHQAVQRGADNAGPLNSHMLVLRTLGLLADLSPDYLRRFLAHADALLWIDEAGTRATRASPSSRRAKTGKA